MNEVQATRGAQQMAEPIYKLALGTAFTRLQPEVQDYFSLAPGSGKYGVGEGIFDVVGCRQRWLRPLLSLTSGEEAFFPDYGEQVPFRIENPAHYDPFGRNSLTARREIYFPGSHRLFHDTTSAETGDDGTTRLVDYLRRYRRLVTDLNLSVTPEGRLRGVSEASRLFLGPLRVALPAALDARAYAEQWGDAERQKHRIQVKVIQPQVGLVLVYAGSFDYKLVAYRSYGGPRPESGLPSYPNPRPWEKHLIR